MQSIRVVRCPAGYESEEEDDFILETQKITILPDKFYAAALNQDFDFSLPPHVEEKFQTFRESYNTYKRTPLTEQQLKLVLTENENPLLLALKLFVISPGCNNLKNKNLALFVLELACEIAAKNPSLTEICDDNTRMVAFNFIKLCGINSIYKETSFNFKQAVIKAYGLKSIRHHLLPKLQELLSKGHYKDVAYWTMFLEMTDSFGIFDLVFPLMLQDKIFLAEEYIDIAQKLQLPVVQFLDSLLNREKTVYEHCDEILAKHKYIDIRHGILLHKPMLKLVSRLAKKYKINEEHTPNLVFSKSCNYLRYLFYKYREGGMNCEAWRELVPDVAQRKEIQLELIKVLVNNNDINEAYYWLERFNIPIDDFPDDVRNLLNQSEHLAKNIESTTDNPSKSSISDTNEAYAQSICEDDYLKLSLNRNQIILVDDERLFYEMLEYLKAQTLIAFDSEWKPSVSSENIVSLLQLATNDRVYLLDCLSLKLKINEWQSLGRDIFNNLEVLKIGFALEHDLRMLQKSLPLQINLQGRKVGFLDIRELWRRLRNLRVMQLPYATNDDTIEGLSALTEACLGKKLDKSNQCSNWSNRPLRPDQITYAALDAYCLLQIYQTFADMLQRIGLDIDKVIEEVTTGKTGYLFQMKSCVIFKNMGPSSSSNEQNCVSSAVSQKPFRSVNEICFICDQDGLTKELRKLGIDCITISNHYFGCNLEGLNREHCFLLTKDPQRYYDHVKEYGREKCIKIHQNSVCHQAVFVLKHFNIKVQERELYTRCLECNGNEFILAFKDDIKQMRLGKARETQEKTQNLKTANVIRHEGHFLLRKINEHILKTNTTYSGQPIRLRRIKEHHLKNAEQFFICDLCGYIIWNGAHPIHGHIVTIIGCKSQRFPCV